MDIVEAAEVLSSAEHLLITAGAGMGVDSGLPDFRGVEGFWRAYPPYARLGLAFEQLANPDSFEADPELGWGFYGHRLGLYRTTVPHDGFRVLLEWARQKKSAFVFTSNIDGQFFRAGFREEEVYEVHGSIHHLQCRVPCSEEVSSTDGLEVRVDMRTMRASPPLPRCPSCGEVARPNVLMFGDGGYVETRQRTQRGRYARFLGAVDGPLAIVEIGAGTSVPTVRFEGERLLRRPRSTLIRINVRESQGPHGTISLAMGGREAVLAIDRAAREK